MCFSYTFEKEEKAASALVENVTGLMPFLEADPCYALPRGLRPYPDLDLYDEAGLGVADDAKIASLLGDGIGHPAASDKRIDEDEKLRAARNGAARRDDQLERPAGGGEKDVLFPERHGRREGRRGRGFLVRLDLVFPVRGARRPEAGEADSGKGRLLSRRRGARDGRLSRASDAGVRLPGTGDTLPPPSFRRTCTRTRRASRTKSATQCFSDLLTIVDSGIEGDGRIPLRRGRRPLPGERAREPWRLSGLPLRHVLWKAARTGSTGNAVRPGRQGAAEVRVRGAFS